MNSRSLNKSISSKPSCFFTT